MNTKKNIFICYKKCSTCKAVQNMLDEQHITYEIREIDKDTPTQEELLTWHKQAGIPLKRFFNTSGLVYRNLGLKDKLATMSIAEQLDLLASNGMLIKRPIFLKGTDVYIGADVKKYLASREE